MNDLKLLLLAALATAGCQDNEQRARAIGSEARDAVALSCSGGAVADAGDVDVASDEAAACTDQRCRTECERREVPKGFGAACLDACRQAGICATSADCGAGKECVAIAPVVRRCVAKAAP